MSLLRLDKIIADSGLATRSEARRLIAEGRVQIGGRAVTRPDFKADAETAEITLDARPLAGGRFRYLMLNKPAGVLSATEDRDQKTVLDLLPEECRRLGLFPVGRLDKDTTGLLLLTNDGDFCHRLTSPGKQVEKRYEVTVDGALDAADAAAFAGGLILRDGTVCLSARLELDENAPGHGFVTVCEGKYHQVKRMLAARGKPVLTLKRLSVGGLVLDPALAPGAFRALTENERDLLVHRIVTK